MAVREFELYHGAVLAKILRSDRPVALRLVETRTEKWSTYTLNDTVDLLVTHRSSGKTVSRNGGGTSWTFVLSPNQLRQLNPEGKIREVYLALVCGIREPATAVSREVCLLYPDEIREIVDFDAEQQGLTIREPSGRAWLRVFKDRREVLLVARSRLEKWDIPGS